MMNLSVDVFYCIVSVVLGVFILLYNGVLLMLLVVIGFWYKEMYKDVFVVVFIIFIIVLFVGVVLVVVGII